MKKESVMSDLTTSEKKALGVDGAVIGLLVGAALFFWALQAQMAGEHLLHTAVGETFWVAAYLTMVVAYAGFKMPVFAAKSPFWSTFGLIVFSGHISLLFDSFAVVLLLATGIVFIDLPGVNSRFNRFAVKTVAAFSALTVGGGFYLGELWGLPWFISHGLDNPLAGFPILAVLTPYCIVLALLTAWLAPVKMEATSFDGKQIQAGLEFVAALLLIIVTHNPFLCIGALFFYSALRRKTMHLVKATAHELTDGAQNALGLIILAVIILEAGWAPLFQPLLQGWGLFLGAAISSPFAGAMAPPADDLHGFYVGLTLIMLGAPMFVFSSLVAIVVFKEEIDHQHLPTILQPISAALGGKKKGFIHEGIVYTVLVIPMNLGLAGLMWAGNASGLFVTLAHLLGVHMGVPVTH